MKKMYLGLAILTLILMWVFGFIYLGYMVTIIVASSATVGLVAWLLFSYKKPPEPEVVLPCFLVMMATLLIHMMEEYYTGFPQAMSALFHMNFTLSTFLIVFVQVGPIIYFLVALGLFYRNSYSHFFAWFLFVGLGIGEISHYIFPVIQGGPYHYFPGMYTAILPMLAGCWAIYRVVKASKTQLNRLEID